MIGKTFGNFRVLAKLGDGGMGSVYRAHDEMIDREVALKVLKPELVKQPALMERFRQEAIALARLNHPRIAALHGLERHGEELVMVMEFLAGDTLESLIHRRGPIAWPRAAELCIDILEALDHAHARGVVHRDIKPANAMLVGDGHVKVMDFGIARLKDKNRQTRMGHAVGTPMYMSPEQLRGEEVDGRADLYAVGAVLFELITGKTAFEAESDYELMMKQLNDPPPAASSVVHAVPPTIDVIIMSAMAKRREERYPNAIAMRDALRLAVADQPADVRLSPLVETRSNAPASTTGSLTAPPATRLAGDAPATRLAEETSPNISANSPLKDWRLWSTAAALLFAIGFAVRTFSVNPLADPSTSADSTVAPPPSSARADTTPAGRAVVPPVQSAVQPGPQRPSVDQLAPNEVAPPPGGSTPRRERTSPTRPNASKPAPVPATTGNTPTPKQDRPIPPPPDPSPAPTPTIEENAASAAPAIAAAIADFASDVGSRNAGAVEAVFRGDGATTTTFIGLVREGRVSMSVSGPPDIDASGGRATARFGASINVRSPFGANRRRAATFSAELARAGSGRWRLVAVRPVGGLDLK